VEVSVAGMLPLLLLLLMTTYDYGSGVVSGRRAPTGAASANSPIILLLPLPLAPLLTHLVLVADGVCMGREREDDVVLSVCTVR
jgi:hypothetical protein